MIKRRHITLFMFLYLAITTQLIAATGTEKMQKALEDFRQGDYSNAVSHFRDITLDPRLEAHHGSAYYWLSRIYIATEDYQSAEQHVIFFINNFPEHTLIVDAKYQKGRLLFLQKEYDKTIQFFSDFSMHFPDYSLLSHVYFWIGESLFSLGNFDEANQLYRHVIQIFPNSTKVEAAQYRVSIIELKKREQALISLLKVSHEEYLKAIEEFQKREKYFEQALSSLQRQLVAETDEDMHYFTEMHTLVLEEKEKKIDELTIENKQLREQLDRLKTTEPITQDIEAITGFDNEEQIKNMIRALEKERELLDLKREALELKELYLEQASLKRSQE